MKDKFCPKKNNCSSSNFPKSHKNLLHYEIANQYKENLEKNLNSNNTQKYAESQKKIRSFYILEKFMQNQDKKHLSTKFAHKDVEKFLKEKDKAMEEIIINEDIMNINENKELSNEIALAKNDGNEEKGLISENEIIKNSPDTKSRHFLIFKGTFGKNEYEKLKNENHHHHHQHHHHHHHHHHKTKDLEISDNKNKEEKINN